MTTSATLESPTSRLEAGEDSAVPLVVRNESDIVEQYQLEVVGLPASWTTAEPSQVTLLPGQSASITLHFRPPRSSAVVAGAYDYGVTVLPSEHPEDVVVLEGSVEVLPYTDTTAELIPRTSRGRRGAAHRVAVDNRGNTPITVAFAGTDRGDLLSFRFQQRVSTIPPGTAEFTRLHVRPIRTILRGTPITHPFSVTVLPPEDPAPAGEAIGSEELVSGPELVPGPKFSPVVLEGTHLQEPVLPPGFLKALLALLLLALGLVVLWLLIFRPAVESAARAAVKESVDAADANAEMAAEGAADASEAAKSAEDAATDAGVAAQQAQTLVGAPTLPETTSPIAQRLEVEASAGATESTPFAFDNPDATLQLTDVIMSNPQGDSGRLRLELDDEVLLDMALENFRDTDYHFLTPIRVSSDQVLQLTMTCNRAGAPPDQTPAPVLCVASALLGGMMATPNP